MISVLLSGLVVEVTARDHGGLSIQSGHVMNSLCRVSGHPPTASIWGRRRQAASAQSRGPVVRKRSTYVIERSGDHAQSGAVG
jgi:hypothetical protein